MEYILGIIAVIFVIWVIFLTFEVRDTKDDIEFLDNNLTKLLNNRGDAFIQRLNHERSRLNALIKQEKTDYTYLDDDIRKINAGRKQTSDNVERKFNSIDAAIKDHLSMKVADEKVMRQLFDLLGYDIVKQDSDKKDWLVVKKTK